MNEQINPSDPNPQDPSQNKPTDPPVVAKRPRRLWLKIGLGVVLLLIILILLIPTIASTSVARQFVVGKINSNLNGTVEIADWSIGWTSGIDVRGVKVFDDQKAEVLSIAHLRTSLSLIDAARGRYHCGDTVVDEPNLEQFVTYADGSNNLQRLVKTAEKEPHKASRDKSDKPSSLDVSGNFTINRPRAMIVAHGAGEPLIVQPESSMHVVVKSINDPIENTIALICRVGSAGTPGTIKIDGTAQVAKNGVVDMDTAVIDEKLELAGIPLQAAAPFLAMAGQQVTLRGTANGAVALKMTGANQLTANGAITADGFAYGGAALNGETFTTSKLNLPIKITRQVVNAQTTRLLIESLGVETDQAVLAISADVSQEALQHLADNTAPGSDGKITVSMRIPNLKLIADQLPKTLHLLDGVKITSGQVFHETNIWLSATKTVVESKSDIDGVAGTNKGQAISLSPIHQTTDVTLLPGRMKLPDLHDLAVTLASGFATVNGGGATLAALNINGTVDLPKLKEQLGQFADLGKLSLGGAGDFAITTHGDLSKTGSPISTEAHLGIKGLTIAQGTSTVIDHDDVSFDAAGQVSTSDAGGIAAKFSKLSLHSSIATIEKGASDLSIQTGTGGVHAAGVLTVTSDVARINALAKSIGNRVGQPDQAGDITAGKLDGTLELTDAASGASIVAKLTGSNLNIITYTQPITNESLAMTANLTTSADGATMSAVAEVKGSFFTLSLQNGRIGLKSSGVWDIAQKADVALTVQLPKAQDYAGRFSAPTTRPAGVALAQADDAAPPARRTRPARVDAPVGPPVDAKGAPVAGTPLPPLKVTSGTATITLALARDAGQQKSTFNNGTVVVDSLAFDRGDGHYAAPADHKQTVALQFAGEIQAAANTAHPDAPVMQQIVKVLFTKLQGEAIGGTLKMPRALSITGFGGTLSAIGGIEIAGRIVDVTTLLDALDANKPGTGYPYTGDYRVAEDLTTSQNVLAVNGSGTITDFQVNGTAGQPAVFTEKKVAFTNDLKYDQDKSNLTITALKLDMQSSDALHVALVGNIMDLQQKRAFDGVKLSLGYDLEKLWPVLRPMMPASQQEEMKEIKMSGKAQREFQLRGSFAAGKPFNEAVKTLTAFGSIALEHFEGYGLTIDKAELPIALDSGVVTTTYFEQSADKKLPPAANCNGGKINLGGLTVDLRGKDPRFTTPKDYKFLAGVTINPLLGNKLGRYINPVFTNSDRAKGQLDVTFNYCEAVALGDGVKAADSGRAKMTFSIRDLDIANPLGSLMVGGLLKSIPTGALSLLGDKGKNFAAVSQNQSDVFDGNIENAVVTLEAGRTTQDITLQLVDPGVQSQQAVPGQPAVAAAVQGKQLPLHFQGEIALVDLKQNLAVTFPAELLAKYIPDKNAAKLINEIFPAGIPLTLRGSTPKPVPDYGDMASRVANGFAKSQLKSVTGGLTGKGDKNDKNDNPLGGLLDAALGGKKNKSKDDKKDDAAPNVTQPQPQQPADTDSGGRRARHTRTPNQPDDTNTPAPDQK